MKKTSILTWFDSSTVKHLRIPFSYFLMPVFLFALSQAETVNWLTTAVAFIILHFIIFPASNGYNSYQDRDETSIGGLKNPPKVSINLFYATLLMDAIGVLCSSLISIDFALFVLGFILMSRAYSYRNIRLKKYPVAGFLTVFIFQGAFVYVMALVAITNKPIDMFSSYTIICMSIASLFMGSVYPLTQIYQHQADKNDGVISLSYKLGYIGTFVFSAILFSVATALLFFLFSWKQQLSNFVVFAFLMLPIIAKLSIWFNKVRKEEKHANYENTMTMNVLTSSCMNIYFLGIILNNYYNWF